jgi:16S rRNA G966 N2-methylase RsmD
LLRHLQQRVQKKQQQKKEVHQQQQQQQMPSQKCKKHKRILNPPKTQQEFVNPPKVQVTPPEIHIIFADPPKKQWTHQKYNNIKKTNQKKEVPFGNHSPNVIKRLTQRASSGPTRKLTEGRAPVWGSELLQKPVHHVVIQKNYFPAFDSGP